MDQYFWIEEEVINDYGLNNKQIEDIYLYWKIKESNPNNRMKFTLKDKKDILETLYGKNMYTEKEIQWINQSLKNNIEEKTSLPKNIDSKLYPFRNETVSIESSIIKNDNHSLDSIIKNDNYFFFIVNSLTILSILLLMLMVEIAYWKKKIKTTPSQ